MLTMKLTLMYKFIFSLIILSNLLYSCKGKFSNIANSSQVTTSAECANSPAKNLIDTDSLTAWNACAGGQQWLDFSFSDEKEIKQITFNVITSKPCTIQYNILSKSSNGNDYQNVASQEVNIENGQLINVEKVIPEAKNLKLIINNDSSWVSLQDVKILGR